MLRLALILGLGAASTCALALEVECEPVYPVFCMNIHAGCAGRTETAALPFKLNAASGRGWIESPDADMRELYANGRAEWEDGETASSSVRSAGRATSGSSQTAGTSSATTAATPASCPTATAARAARIGTIGPILDLPAASTMGR